MNLSTEKKIMDLENRHVVAKREGMGRIRSLALIDANYCSWNGFTMRSCCVALRTMSRYLQCSMTMGEKIMYTVCVTGSPCCTVEKNNCVGGNNNKNK